MDILTKIPFLDVLLESKKAKVLATLIGLFLVRDNLGLDAMAMQYISFAFMAYFVAQGMKDLGEQLALRWKGAEADEVEEPEEDVFEGTDAE